MVKADLQGRAGGGVAQFAGADHGAHPALVDEADPVVVPVEDIGAPVGAEGQVLGQVETRLEQGDIVGPLTGLTVAGEGCDAGVRTRLDSGGGRAAGLQRQGGGQGQQVDRKIYHKGDSAYAVVVGVGDVEAAMSVEFEAGGPAERRHHLFSSSSAFDDAPPFCPVVKPRDLFGNPGLRKQRCRVLI